MKASIQEHAAPESVAREDLQQAKHISRMLSDLIGANRFSTSPAIV
jgi:hypothetical protein|tara:strand:+ start:2826 stop:2963 length:138 start_codon:yes stop_codon:yes gene_type:complete